MALLALEMLHFCCTGAQRADTQLRGDRGTPGGTSPCDMTLCHSSDSTARNPTNRGHTALLAFTLEVKCHLFFFFTAFSLYSSLL